MDFLSFLGYTRINSTHTHLSSDAEAIKRNTDTLKKIVEKRFPGELVYPITDVLTPKIMHGRVHGTSIHGAVGFMGFWTSTVSCAEVVQIRNHPIGDKWKGPAIALAGYVCLTSHPIVAGILRVVAGEVEALRESLEMFRNQWWLSSSLSPVFCAKGTAAQPLEIVATTMLLAAMITAAAEIELLPGSFKRAHFIKNFKAANGGAVEFWKAYFDGISQRVGRMSDAEVRRVVEISRSKAIADDPARAAIAGAQAAAGAAAA